MPGEGREEDHGSGSLTEAIEDVFRTMLRQECSVLQAGGAVQGISATIDFSGSFAGRCTVVMREPAAYRMTDAMLGSEGDWDEQMIDDAVGELCNMVAGGWKSRLEEDRSDCHLSVPMVSRTLPGGAPVGSLRRRYGFGGHELDVWIEIVPEDGEIPLIA